MKFNREKSKQFTMLECNEKKNVESFGKVMLTAFGICILLYGSALFEKQASNNLYSNNNGDSSSNIKVVVSDYDRARAKYLEKVHEYRDNFDDRGLLDFYKNGKLIVNYNGNKIESNIKALYLRYGYINNNKFIFLSNVLNGRNVDFFTGVDNYYAEDYSIIEFRNTTVFEELYKKHSFQISVGNSIILNEEDTKELISMLNTWDGKINNMVPETMAVENKQVWEEVTGEKER